MPQHTRIKICSICRPEDGVTAARAGADAIGLILHPPSPRNLSIEQAREVLRVLPPFVNAVGVFVDRPLDELRDIAAALRLRHVQLSGHESEEYVASLSDFVIMKAVKVRRESVVEDFTHWRHVAKRNPHLRALLLESPGPGPGGTGVANDFASLRAAIDSGALKNLPPLIAAGGLRPETVADVVRSLRPFAVDVSSGVEEALRVKSPAKIQAFCDAVRSADNAAA